ncbi:hypothetical protein C8J57DRAFT_1309111 [Mycena rebaudengoi]|nr:hypothetical protein C8J57DRAFT_1309111 [Mycena rebaudengoi]
MQRSFIVLLFLGLVRAVLQNFTVDDTSPDISYHEATFHCDATTTCAAELSEAFNQSATLTLGPITFAFAGSAIYISLDLVGTASINIDNETTRTLNVSITDAIAGKGILDFIAIPDLTNGLHTLVIAPLTNMTVIAFDHLIYTTSIGNNNSSSHVGAIVGGVIGGLALTLGALFAAVYARRRKLILRRNQRKSVVLRGMISPRPDHKPGASDGTDLPT